MCIRDRSFRGISSRFDCRPDHAGRWKTGLVSQATIWTLPGVWCAKLDVFWRYVSALVCGTTKPLRRGQPRMDTEDTNELKCRSLNDESRRNDESSNDENA